MVGQLLGPRGSPIHTGAGLSPARARVAAAFCRDLRSGGAQPRARILARGNGVAEPSGCGLRVRPDAEGVRLPLGPGARALRRARGGWRANPPAARSRSEEHTSEL